jgi:sugar-specific transcriptional regulator TrmB
MPPDLPSNPLVSTNVELLNQGRIIFGRFFPWVAFLALAVYGYIQLENAHKTSEQRLIESLKTYAKTIEEQANNYAKRIEEQATNSESVRQKVNSSLSTELDTLSKMALMQKTFIEESNKFVEDRLKRTKEEVDEKTATAKAAIEHEKKVQTEISEKQKEFAKLQETIAKKDEQFKWAVKITEGVAGDLGTALIKSQKEVKALQEEIDRLKGTPRESDKPAGGVPSNPGKLIEPATLTNLPAATR